MNEFENIALGILGGLIIGFILALVLFVIRTKYIQSNHKETEEKTISSTKEITNEKLFERKYLLTKNELSFYSKLKIIAEKYDLHILCKIRVADLMQPIHTNNKND